jgi:hypothetical protein
MSSTDLHLTIIGCDIAMGGLGLALASFMLFAGLVLRLQRLSDRYRKEPNDNRWKRIVIPLWVNIVCLTIRSVYRILEFNEGFNGYLLTHEAYLYGFDTLMVLIGMVSYLLIPPGRYLPARFSDQKVEVTDMTDTPSTYVDEPVDSKSHAPHNIDMKQLGIETPYDH